MKPFLDRNVCTSRVHCRSCRVYADWVVAVGSPVICPYGVTLESLPVPTDWFLDRMRICKECDKETCTFKQCSCKGGSKLKRPNQCCPDNKWLPKE